MHCALIWTKICIQLHACACAAFVKASVCTLSLSRFEYNSPLWHCWRELSKQLSRPLLWLRSARRTVGWREQLKESQSAARSQTCQHSGEAEYGRATRLRSSDGTAQRSCLTWNCHQIYLLLLNWSCLFQCCCFIRQYVLFWFIIQILLWISHLFCLPQFTAALSHQYM